MRTCCAGDAFNLCGAAGTVQVSHINLLQCDSDHQNTISTMTLFSTSFPVILEPLFCHLSFISDVISAKGQRVNSSSHAERWCDHTEQAWIWILLHISKITANHSGDHDLLCFRWWNNPTRSSVVPVGGVRNADDGVWHGLGFVSHFQILDLQAHQFCL